MRLAIQWGCSHRFVFNVGNYCFRFFAQLLRLRTLEFEQFEFQPFQSFPIRALLFSSAKYYLAVALPSRSPLCRCFHHPATRTLKECTYSFSCFGRTSASVQLERSKVWKVQSGSLRLVKSISLSEFSCASSRSSALIWCFCFHSNFASLKTSL